MPGRRMRKNGSDSAEDPGPLRKCYTAVNQNKFFSQSVKNMDLNPSEKTQDNDSRFVQSIAAAMAWPLTFSSIKMDSDGLSYNSAESRLF